MREFIRHPATIPLSIQQTDPGDHEIHTLNNVSLGGIACKSNKELPEGTMVDLRIDYVEPPFEVSGVVKWCRPEDEIYSIGIQFLVTDDDAHRLRMIEQVCHIEHYRNEVLMKENRTLTSEEAATEWINRYASSFPR